MGWIENPEFSLTSCTDSALSKNAFTIMLTCELHCQRAESMNDLVYENLIHAAAYLPVWHYFISNQF
jgi:hypothetical protein